MISARLLVWLRKESENERRMREEVKRRNCDFSVIAEFTKSIPTGILIVSIPVPYNLIRLEQAEIAGESVSEEWGNSRVCRVRVAKLFWLAEINPTSIRALQEYPSRTRVSNEVLRSSWKKVQPDLSSSFPEPESSMAATIHNGT